MNIAKYLFFIILIIGGFVLLSNAHAFAAINLSQPISVDLNQYIAGSMASERATLPDFDGDGVLFIDESGRAPGVPYIIYDSPKGGTGIKELIFMTADSQPCQVSAGEYPCAKDIDGYDGTDSDASPVPSGTLVHLVGGVDDQGIVVKSLDSATSTPANMIRFSTPFGTTSHVSNGLSITPTKLMTNASCTLGVGCVGNGTQRVEVTLEQGGSLSTTDLIPGSVFVYGKSTIILISANGSDTTGTADFLVASR